jgi:polo-like kinase 1
MFRLSNNMIQSIFDDGSEVMFNSITKFVTFVDKLGEKKHTTMQDALTGDNV